MKAPEFGCYGCSSNDEGATVISSLTSSEDGGLIGFCQSSSTVAWLAVDGVAYCGGFELEQAN